MGSAAGTAETTKAAAISEWIRAAARTQAFRMDVGGMCSGLGVVVKAS